MGVDYRFLLFFERGAHIDALEGLAAIADPGAGETTLVRDDRVALLPFDAWLETPSRISADDPSPTWDFQTVLCFEPDDDMEDYIDAQSDWYREQLRDYDALGRVSIGTIYLSVHNDMTEQPTGTDEDLVMFDFNTPGSSMSRLFAASESIWQAFTNLLASFSGVYGVFDREEWQELFWWRGDPIRLDRDVTGLSLAEIDRMVRSER